MKPRFENTFSFKLIYVFSTPYDTHKGCLKVGETTLKTSKKVDELIPNCHELNQAAKQRIRQYVGTGSFEYQLEYTELAIRLENNKYKTFIDKDVHNVLKNSGIKNIRPNEKTGEEWFKTNIQNVKEAIKCVKEGKSSIPGSKFFESNQTAISFRHEQNEAIEKALKNFKKADCTLWNAKMRFGKTLSALEVVRRAQYRRVIIITHRPIVDDSWNEDFKKIFFAGNSENEYSYERKSKDSNYTFDEKIDLENDKKIKKLDENGSYFIYFASIQDLRGSKIVEGEYDKNNAVFDLDWDLIIIDEAHEGTQTELGENVRNKLKKKNTKILELSGTPFNLLYKYDAKSVYTWDYVMEQKAKVEWDNFHNFDHNPYADLPKMHIYTYDLSEKLKQYVKSEFGSKAFNFSEFFRVWSKGHDTRRAIPKYATEGKFVHENDVKAFLDMLVSENESIGYPFSNNEYRDMFRHTLWVVPGVKEAKALSVLLREHPVFRHFGIANVAGEGDRYENERSEDALELVRKTIKKHDYSITLSCGKLTTGVTVPEWTAVLMLAGSYNTAASQYLQTIFRVQSVGQINGKQKTDCYVFDFAPDRTLKVLTDAVNLSRKPGKNQNKNREALSEFLNFCPVISISGSRTKEYNVDSMMQQIKHVYAERAFKSGFEDESLYSDELLKLTDKDALNFNELKNRIGSSGPQRKTDQVIVNNQGLTEEEIERINDYADSDKLIKKLTPEQLAEQERIKQAKEARKKAISILRAISVRMPLMIYGADIPIDEDIDIEKFIEMVDEKSWKEFMPKDVDKKLFKQFIKFYDRDVFIAAGKLIRQRAAEADEEMPTRRVMQIADIFRYFKNPDKETVLTPWRVVNLHMAETIGGWCFFNEKYEDDTKEDKRLLEEPRFVEQKITNTIFSKDAKILDINSKTGLYPLYVAYSFYRQLIGTNEEIDLEKCTRLWNDVVSKNIYAICQTPMAKTITRRTLCGYKKTTYNAHCFDDLVNMLIHKPEQFKKRILKASYWNKGEGNMKFDGIIGNPPYQIQTAKHESLTNGQATTKSIFQYFQLVADDVSSGIVSLIYPGARWIHQSGKGMSAFGDKQINDEKLSKLLFFPISSEIFSDVDIADGLSIVFKNKIDTSTCFDYVYCKNGEKISINMESPGKELMELNPYDSNIVKKVSAFVRKYNIKFLHDRIHSRNLFGIESDFVEKNPSKVRILEKNSKIDFSKEIKLFTNDKAGSAGRATWYIADKNVIQSNSEYINQWKVIVSSANAGGQKRNKQIQIVDNHSAFGRSRVALGSFKTKKEAENFYNYCECSLIKFMFLMTAELLTSLGKKVPDILDYSDKNKLINFKENIDQQLYKLIGLNKDEINYIESITKKKYS